MMITYYVIVVPKLASLQYIMKPSETNLSLDGATPDWLEAPWILDLPTPLSLI